MTFNRHDKSSPCFKLSLLSSFYPDRHTDPLLIGDENPALLIITAKNDGEGAYETELHVRLPPQTHYQGLLRDEEVRAAYFTLNLYAY